MNHQDKDNPLNKNRPLYFAKHLILCAAIILFLTGATVSTEVSSEIFQFPNKTIFLKYAHDDRMELKPFVVDELEKMGFKFVTSEQNAEMIAMFRYRCIWDILGLKLTRFRIKISDRKTHEKLAGGTSAVTMVNMGTDEMMVREVFKEISRELNQKENALKSSGHRTFMAEKLPEPPRSPEMIAVADITATGLSQTEKVILSDYFRKVLSKTSYFKVIRTEEMKLTLLEQNYRPATPCDQPCLMQMGQTLAASKIVSGTLVHQGGIIRIDLQLIDTASGAAEVSISDEIEYSEKLLNAMERAGRKLVVRYAALQN